MAMSPEEIAEREFLVGLRGYDKDEVRDFLTDVASDYRSLLESAQASPDGAAGPDAPGTDVATQPAEAEVAAAPTEAAAVPGAGTGTTSPQDWARMGEEVAAVLRTAHEQVDALKGRAEEDAAERRRAAEAQADLTKVEAEKYAADLRTNAEAWAESRQGEADADRDEAKRVLANAQDEALSLVADAEKRANRMLAATERKARSRAEEALETARAQLRQLHESQAEAHQRLETARTFVSQAIDTFQTSSSDGLAEPAAVIDEPDADDAEVDAEVDTTA